MTADQVLAQLRRHSFTLEPDGAPRGSAAAELWRITDPATGRTGKVGLIASVSHPFCSTCNRARLTADGQLRSCLFAMEETDLRGCCAAAPTTTRSKRRGGRRSGPNRRVTASTTPNSSSRRGR